MTIVNQLRVLGLGDYEAAVYAVLLETSPQSATVIAKKCALSRSSVYDPEFVDSQGLSGHIT
jgi:sugar-specific transcriptional regulator TrmB